MNPALDTKAVDLGYLACPVDGAHPGVIMIHDVWGLSDHTRDYARRLAGEGFTVLAIDLYRAERARGELSISDPGTFMRSLSDPAILVEIQRAVDWLGTHDRVSPNAVGVLGFCMGGMYALLAGCGLRGVRAVVPFYGILSHRHGLLHDPNGLDPAKKPREPLDAVKSLGCPMLAFFGDEDAFIPKSDIAELEARLEGEAADANVVLYEGAGHAFMNDTRPAAFRPDAARDAWSKAVAFLRERLARAS